MRILLTMNLPYEPALGGANKANRAIAEALASRGHSVRVVVPTAHARISPSHATPPPKQDTYRNGVRRFTSKLVDVVSVESSATTLQSCLRSTIHDFKPERILVSSEDSMYRLLREAIEYNSKRVAYIAHAPNCFPFGPFSFFPSSKGTQMIKQAGRIITVSSFCKDYIKRWTNIDAYHVYLPVFGHPPFPYYHNFGKGFITFINPCAYKGIDIFLQLASLNPHIRFAAVPSWGTTTTDRMRISALPNIKLLDRAPLIDSIFRVTSILVVPSLWLENLPAVIIEAILRGIPVIASNIGGIPEAKLGTNYLVPVVPIERFRKEWDENNLWIPEIPDQDMSLWQESLLKLTSDANAYEMESALGRDAAHQFVNALNFETVEQLLLQDHDL